MIRFRAVLRALSIACSMAMLTACITPTNNAKKPRPAKNGAKVADGKSGYGLYNRSRDLDKKLLERGERSRFGSSLGSL